MNTLCGSSSVGRVSAFQADCREFESRLPLHFNKAREISLAFYVSEVLSMKKIFLGFTIIYLLSNAAFATFDPRYNPEENVNIKSLNSQQYEQAKQDAEEREKMQQNMMQQGQDYMYRMQQQMMAPPSFNQFGGYRY